MPGLRPVNRDAVSVDRSDMDSAERSEAARAKVRARIAEGAAKGMPLDALLGAAWVPARASEDRSALARLSADMGRSVALHIREAPRSAGAPANRWWFVPELGLDRPRYPWDPEDLPEIMRATASAEGL